MVVACVMAKSVLRPGVFLDDAGQEGRKKMGCMLCLGSCVRFSC